MASNTCTTSLWSVSFVPQYTVPHCAHSPEHCLYSVPTVYCIYWSMCLQFFDVHADPTNYAVQPSGLARLQPKRLQKVRLRSNPIYRPQKCSNMRLFNEAVLCNACHKLSKWLPTSLTILLQCESYSTSSSSNYCGEVTLGSNCAAVSSTTLVQIVILVGMAMLGDVRPDILPCEILTCEFRDEWHIHCAHCTSTSINV